LDDRVVFGQQSGVGGGGEMVSVAAPGDSNQTKGPRRHQRRRWLLGTAAVVLVAIGVFAFFWFTTGAHEVSLSTADQRFRHDKGALAGFSKPGRPAEGVYEYKGSGSEALSLPPKTQHEGPLIPGTVTYGANGCWMLRMDYSDNHWQSTTYCPRGTQLLETARGGWYQWNFVATTVADTASYTCKPAEIAVPGVLARNRRYRFSCTGTNHPLKLPPVTLAGSVKYLGDGSVLVDGKKVLAVRILEVARFTGGQKGQDVENTWYDSADGLPLQGTWSTDVRTPTAIGNSTLTASGRFQLDSLVPHG
jgi:hypothetical protein